MFCEDEDKYCDREVYEDGCEVENVPCSWCAKLGLRCTKCKVGELEQKEKRLSASLAHHQFSLNNLRALLTKLDKEDAEAGVVSDEDK